MILFGWNTPPKPKTRREIMEFIEMNIVTDEQLEKAQELAQQNAQTATEYCLVTPPRW
jgi:hypothetical protein